MTHVKMTPVHPGEILSEDFLSPMRISRAFIAKGLNLPEADIDDIVEGRRRIEADTALRLARFFGNSAQFWFGMQMQYDLDKADELHGDRIDKEVSVYRQES